MLTLVTNNLTGITEEIDIPEIESETIIDQQLPTESEQIEALELGLLEVILNG